MPDKPGHRGNGEDLAHGVPPIAVSRTTTLVNKTGSWKYIRPVYRDRVAPCNQRCPVGIDIEAYMNLLREGRAAEATEILLRENPLPAVTGRVCHHPCETACNRTGFDAPVAIHSIERMLGDLSLQTPPEEEPAQARGLGAAKARATPPASISLTSMAQVNEPVTGSRLPGSISTVRSTLRPAAWSRGNEIPGTMTIAS